jgi:uncharacterized Zn-finger protein
MERRYTCVICPKRFGSKQNLEQHLSVHTGLSPWNCGLCEMSFKRQHHFKNHMKTSGHKTKYKGHQVQGHDDDDPEVKKPIIDILVIQGNNIVDEELDKPHKCQVCGTCYKFDFHLKQHLKSKGHKIKVDEKLNRGEPVPDHLIVDNMAFVELDPSFVEQNSKFNDEDLINLADSANSELFLDDSNVQLIIVNEANQDVMLMTTSSNKDEVKLSDSAPRDNLMSHMTLDTE